MEAGRRPKVRFLDEAVVERVISAAHELLWKRGIFAESEDGLEALARGGALVDKAAMTARLPAAAVDRALETAPREVVLHGLDGAPAALLGGDRVHFYTGATALLFRDSDGEIRPARTEDLRRSIKVTDRLGHVAVASTAMVCSEVPAPVADLYRLAIVLKHTSKPVVTGTFGVEGFGPMREMLDVVSPEGRAGAVPRAVFAACMSPPLKLTHISTWSLLDAAQSGLPVVTIPMPLAGGTAPATLMGAVVQHTAEALAALVVSQAARPGAPFIYGGSPTIMDMRGATTPMGAVEAALIDGAYAQVGKRLGLPTHAYLGLSDSKAPDAQAGLEAGMNMTLGALAGVNLMCGVGMLELENCQSLEKLVIDDDICGMALRLIRGITPRESAFDPATWQAVGLGETFLTQPETVVLYREEQFLPSPVIDRDEAEIWRRGGGRDAEERARERAEHILGEAPPCVLNTEQAAEIDRIVVRAFEPHGGRSALPAAYFETEA